MRRSGKVSLIVILMLFMLLSAIGPIVAVGYSALSSIADERKESTEALLSKQAAQVQQYQSDVESVLLTLSGNQYLNAYLLQMYRDPSRLNPATLNQVQNVLANNDYLRGPYTIDLVTPSQLVYTTESGGQAGKRYTPELISEWIDAAATDGSAIYYAGKIPVQIRDIPGPAVASIYPLLFFDAMQKETKTIGFIAINYSFEEALMIASQASDLAGLANDPLIGSDQGTQIHSEPAFADTPIPANNLNDMTVILDGSNKVVADRGGFFNGVPDITSYLPDSTEASGQYLREVQNQQYVITYIQMAEPQLLFLHIANTNVFFSTTISSQNGTVQVFIISLLVTVGVAAIISYIIISPIHRITSAFGQIKDGTFDWNYRIRPSWMREMNDMVSLLNGFLDFQVLQKRTEADLQASQEKFRNLFENSPVPMWELNLSTVIAALDEKHLTEKGLEEYLRNHPEECYALISKVEILDVNKRTLKLFQARDVDELRRNQVARFKGTESEKILEQLLSIYRKQRRFEQVLANSTPKAKKLIIHLQWTVHPGSRDKMDRVVVTTLDITEQEKVMRLQNAILRISQAAITVNKVSDLFEIIHETLETLMPARNMYIAFYDSKSEMISFPYFSDEKDEPPPARKFGDGWTEFVIQSGKPVLINEEEKSELELKVQGTRPVCWLGAPLIVQDKIIGVLVIQSYDQATRYTDDDKDLLTIAANQIAMAIYKKKTEEHLVFSSSHDELTGLNNRAYFDEEVSRLSELPQAAIGVIMMDLDNLKVTNDQYGHAAGDELIRTTATIIRSAFRMDDMIARIGGDEFVVLIENASMENVQTAIDRIQANLDRYNSVLEDDFRSIHLSIGGSVTDFQTTLSEAIRMADEEMYRVKAEHKAGRRKL